MVPSTVNIHITLTSVINFWTVGRIWAGHDSQMAAMHMERER